MGLSRAGAAAKRSFSSESKRGYGVSRGVLARRAELSEWVHKPGIDVPRPARHDFPDMLALGNSTDVMSRHCSMFSCLIYFLCYIVCTVSGHGTRPRAQTHQSGFVNTDELNSSVMMRYFLRMFVFDKLHIFTLFAIPRCSVSFGNKYSVCKESSP